MTTDDGTLTAEDEAVEAQLRQIAALVEGMPPRTTAAAVRGRRTVSPARAARRPAPLATKVAVVLFVALVATVGVLAAVDQSPYSKGVLPRVTTLIPTNTFLPGTTGPCAGQPPGCGSPQSSAAALAAGSWSTFPAGPLSQRIGQVEVWTGKELIVWGGEINLASLGGLQVTADGAAYDPSTRTWRMLPPAPLSARTGAAAVWTGSEMVVVGGVSGLDGQIGHDDAAAYDPATNTWTTLPPFPLEPRSDATAVWTGRQLIVFGGDGAGTGRDRGLLDGALYTPGDDTWSALPAIPDQPGWKVLGTTPAWTGRQLIVWATWQKSGPCGNGCGYVDEREIGFSLAAGPGTWRVLGKPKIETSTAATAWTGSGVLVFGGVYCPLSCPPPIGTGALYDPATGSWQSVHDFSTLEVQWPAVWTGRAFVDEEQQVGLTGTPLRAYDPATQQWLELPPPPVAGAGQPPAVWTGTQLLVWGPTSEVLTAG